MIVRGVEDDGRATQDPAIAQRADKAVAIHGGHEDVRDDRLGPVRIRHREAVEAFAGHDREVAVPAQQSDQQIAVDDLVIDDEDRGHGMRSGKQDGWSIFGEKPRQPRALRSDARPRSCSRRYATHRHAPGQLLRRRW